MKNSNVILQIIKKKQELSQEKKPKYATRKLSIGLVSCMLGFSLLFTPNSSNAKGVDAGGLEENYLGEDLVNEDSNYTNTLKDEVDKTEELLNKNENLQKEADIYQPILKENIKFEENLEASGLIENLDKLPENIKIEWEK